MRLIIDLPNTEITGDIIRNGEWLSDSLFDKVIRGAIKNATIIPENATNGDMIKTMFPNNEIEIKKGVVWVHRFGSDGGWQRFLEDWWNAPYKTESEVKE